jgi:ankyrin repeat protein
MKLLTISIMSALIFLVCGCKKIPNTHQAELNTLFLAAQYGDVLAISTLVKKGEKIDQVDSYGRTPLTYAVMEHHMEATKILISLGANTHTKTTKGYDLIMLSLYNDKDASIDMLNYLISLGLAIDEKTPDGDSALNIALHSRSKDAVARLIALGALPNEKSNEILNNDHDPEIVKLINSAKLVKKR